MAVVEVVATTTIITIATVIVTATTVVVEEAAEAEAEVDGEDTGTGEDGLGEAAMPMPTQVVVAMRTLRKAARKLLIMLAECFFLWALGSVQPFVTR